MAILLSFVFKIIPLYLNILLGFLAGKILDANRDTIARIMLFLVNPLVIFNGIIHTKIDAGVLALPFLTFGISSFLCLAFYRLSKIIWQDSTCNLVAFSAGAGNTGYFGIPLALLLFNEQAEGLYIMAFLGISLFENTLGYYMFAKGKYEASACMRQLLKLPAIYAFAAGLAVNYFSAPIPDVFVEFIKHIKGTYTVLGMMIIGLGLAGLTSFKLDFKFIGITFFAKFILWPLIIFLIINADIYLFGFFNENIYNSLILIGVVPLAANMVIMASLLENQPEKAATAVLLSTLVPLIYVPFTAAYLIF